MMKAIIGKNTKDTSKDEFCRLDEDLCKKQTKRGLKSEMRLEYVQKPASSTRPGKGSRSR